MARGLRQTHSPAIRPAAMVAFRCRSLKYAGQVTIAFPVTLSRAVAAPVTFDVSTANGSAQGGVDFVARAQSRLGRLGFPDLAIAVNVSLVQFLHGDLTHRLYRPEPYTIKTGPLPITEYRSELRFEPAGANETKLVWRAGSRCRARRCGWPHTSPARSP